MASNDMIESAFKTLQGNFRRQFPPKGVADILPELIKQPDAAIEKAVDHICLNCTYLPAPAAFLQAVNDEARKIAAEESRKREREWAEQKGGETPEQVRRQGSIFTKEQSDQHGRHAVKAILLMFTDASREDKLDCFKAMEASYPGVGWGKAGADLQRFWKEGRMWTS